MSVSFFERRAFKLPAYEVIAGLGVPQLLHRIFLRDEVTIVAYHGILPRQLKVDHTCFISESCFRNQIRYLKRHFETIHLSEAIERIRNGTIYRPTAVITFDDGFQNNFDVAFPILCESELPATIFLTTGLINTDDTVWFCRLSRALARTSKHVLEWKGQRFDMSAPGPRFETLVGIQARLKELAHPELIVELREIMVELGDDPDYPIGIGSPYRMLSGEAIKEMAATGLIEFGAHTHTHAILSRLSAEKREDEIRRSVTAVRELTGRPCQLFSYPNGLAQDYDAETITTLENCGIRAAVSCIAGPNDGGTPIMELRRYAIGGEMSIANFQLKVHHLISQVRRLIP